MGWHVRFSYVLLGSLLHVPVRLICSRKLQCSSSTLDQVGWSWSISIAILILSIQPIVDEYNLEVGTRWNNRNRRFSGPPVCILPARVPVDEPVWGCADSPSPAPELLGRNCHGIALPGNLILLEFFVKRLSDGADWAIKNGLACFGVDNYYELLWYTQYMLTLRKHTYALYMPRMFTKSPWYSQKVSTRTISWSRLAVPSDIIGSCQNTKTTLCPGRQVNSFAALTFITLIPTFLGSKSCQELWAQTSKHRKRSRHQKGWNKSDSKYSNAFAFRAL